MISIAAMIYINQKANKAKPDFITQRRIERCVHLHTSCSPPCPNTIFIDSVRPQGASLDRPLHPAVHSMPKFQLWRLSVLHMTRKQPPGIPTARRTTLRRRCRALMSTLAWTVTSEPRLAIYVCPRVFLLPVQVQRARVCILTILHELSLHLLASRWLALRDAGALKTPLYLHVAGSYPGDRPST